MTKSQQTMIVAALMLVFTTLFLHNTKSDFGLIFQKDLLAHDESSNSVVAANITRKFFPPMVRVNPLVDQQGNWMEGPFWQHIPPLFAYVPYLFFKLDGQITIEVKRLSYAFVTLLTGLLFIFGIYRFRKNLWAAFAATLAAIFWINAPFTHELITGYAFGVSDIILAFTIVLAFCSILWYLEKDKTERLDYPIWKLCLISLAVVLPIIAKNVLGAIPAATFFGLLLWEHRKFNKQIAASLGAGVILAMFYFLSLYFSSPATFNNEILLSFNHFKSLEGWQRPWHWYVTSYLPQRYLGRWTALFYFVLVLGLLRMTKKAGDRKDQVLLWLSGGWFVWNLIAISAVTSKVPNFIYQSFLMSLFFVTYTITTLLRSRILALSHPGIPPQRNLWARNIRDLVARVPGWVLTVVLIFSILVTGYEAVRFGRQFNVQRAQAYNYQSEHEKFYQTAEELRALGLNTKDLIIVRLDDSDCWFRYYPLFVTGTESKALLEISFGYDAYAIKDKYQRMFFITNKTDRLSQEFPDVTELTNYTLYKFDLTKLSPGQINDVVANFIADHDRDIAQDILRIKKDKTSCQWLVPDPILNAP